jgi:hypothetical protein
MWVAKLKRKSATVVVVEVVFFGREFFKLESFHENSGREKESAYF